MTDSKKSTRAISLRRPWPSLIFDAGKDVENRRWRTSFRGQLVIYAAKKLDTEAHQRHGIEGEIGYLGVVDLVDVHSPTYCRIHHAGSCSPWAEPEAWHWILRAPRLFPEPIVLPGRHTLHVPPAEVLKAVKALGGDHG